MDINPGCGKEERGIPTTEGTDKVNMAVRTPFTDKYCECHRISKLTVDCHRIATPTPSHQFLRDAGTGMSPDDLVPTSEQQQKTFGARGMLKS